MSNPGGKAPILVFNGAKTQDNQKTNQEYRIPQHLADIVFNELGNASAQLRLMIVLIGTKEGFGVSEDWILQRTGLLHSSYINARKALVERGWLTCGNGKIIIEFDRIYQSCGITKKK